MRGVGRVLARSAEETKQVTISLGEGIGEGFEGEEIGRRVS